MATLRRVDRERLRRIRNFQSLDFYPALVLRPLTILIMLVVADWKWLTPNLLTSLCNIAKLAAIALILMGDPGSLIAAAIVLQAAGVLDNLDGTMARYRGMASPMGSYYDKVSDVITWFPIVVAIGWVAHERSGDGMMILLPAVSAYCLAVMGYLKWLVYFERQRLLWLQARQDPAAAVAEQCKRKPVSTPPERSAGDWVKWFLWKLVQAVRFEEIDLYFWVGLFLILNELELLMWILGITQCMQLAAMVFVRTREIHTIDRDVQDQRASTPELE